MKSGRFSDHTIRPFLRGAVGSAAMVAVPPGEDLEVPPSTCLKLLRIADVQLVLLNLGLFFYLGTHYSLLSWALCLGTALCVARIAQQRRLLDDKARRMLLTSFLSLSAIGLLICVDNENNFGMLFGRGGDDARYFEAAAALVEGERPEEFGVYECLLAVWGRALHPLRTDSLEPTDLLPLNWLMAACCVALAGQLALEIVGKPCPSYLLLLSLVANMQFADSTTRLYRDVGMLLFLLVFLLFLVRRENVKAVLALLPVAAIRTANGALGLLFAGVLFLKRRIQSRLAFFALLGVFGGATAVFAVRRADINILMYASDLSRFGRYTRAFGQFSTVEQFELRQEGLTSTAEYAADDNLRRQAYVEGGVKGGIIRGLYTLFFPLTFHSPTTPMPVSPTVSPSRVVEGFYLYYVIQWFFILVWVAVIPYLLIGLYRAALGTDLHVTVFVCYLTTVLLVVLISGQARHGCAFVIFHPVFVSLGFHASRDSNRLWSAHKFLVLATILGILGWNLIRHEVI